MKLTGKILTLGAITLCMNATVMKAQSALYPQQFNLADVELTSSPFLHAMMLNDSVLLAYDKGRLMQPFEKQAGLEESGKAYANWSGGVGAGLDGHIGGHYLSALAISYAACHDARMKAQLKERMDWFIARLKDCQDKWNKNQKPAMHGYVGGVPESYKVFANLVNHDYDLFRRSWVPLYNVHKAMAGLRDAWLYAGSETAKDMFIKECDWLANLIHGISDKDLQMLLDNEHGGVNEVEADAYAMTGNKKYLDAARRLSHQWLVNGMVKHNLTTLDNHHANTQVPKVIGFERIWELSKNRTYDDAAAFFWKDVVENRTIAIGGNSINEWFPARNSYGKFTTSAEGVETCNTYNMLKLSEMEFNDTHDGRYTDFYENAMYNHILSAQNPKTGGYVYFTSARPQHYRVYSQVNQAMWCCVGSGMEDHGKYGEYVYTHSLSNDTLFVNLFVPTRLDWKARKMKITQTTAFPSQQSTSLTVQGNGQFAMAVRKPSWCKRYAISVNGKPAAFTEKNGYAYISRKWKTGDKVSVSLPMDIEIVPLQNNTDYVAFKYGPILLGAKTSDDNLTGLYADESRMGQIAAGQQKDLYSAPLLIGDRAKLKSAIKPINLKKLTFRIEGYYNDKKWNNLVLEPFNGIHESRYMMYWMNVTPQRWQAIRDELEAQEAAKQVINKRTIDQVVTGTQQSENDHYMQQDGSEAGSWQGEYYRHCKPGSWFSYQLDPKGQTENVSLLVRHYGIDVRHFDILIDGEKLTTAIQDGKEGSFFVNVEYPIPAAMLQGKKTIRVKFDANANTFAGGIFDIRLLRK